jgi:putative secretion ATPase (PEP-CTERM system associated)
MYEKFYSLRDLPFRLTPDAGYFFDSRVHSTVLSYLLYGLEKAEGFVVVTGEVGAGKTILIDHLLSQLDPAAYVAAKISTTHLQPEDLLRVIAAAFGFVTENADKATLLSRMRSAWIEAQRIGRQPIVLVDEVQNLPFASLEELRMLSNLTEGGRSLLQTVLIGQPQFRQTLTGPDCEQLVQRVVAACHLKPMDPGETRDYVMHRLKNAGWFGDPAIDDDVFGIIFRATGGMPRRINLLFDRLLVLGFLEERHEIGRLQAEQVVREMIDEGLVSRLHQVARESHS